MDKLFKSTLERIANKEKALSYSSLSAFLKSPRHYYKYVTNKDSTEAMEKGKRFHMAILEPDKFEEAYWVLDDSEIINDLLTNGYIDSTGKHKIPTSPRAIKPYKDWKAGQIALNTDKECIDKSEYDTYQSMIQVLKTHSICKNILFGEGENEVGFEYDTENFKIAGKIDRRTSEYTVDIKKVADARYKKVKWNIEDMNYDLQTVIYSNANRTQKHYLIFIDEGCNVTVVEITPETIERYEEKYNRGLESFQKCLEEDSWHMSYDFWQPLVRI